MPDLFLPTKPEVDLPPQTLLELEARHAAGILTIEDVIECPEVDSDVVFQLKEMCWLNGRLRYLTRRGPQRRIYDQIHSASMSFANLSPYVFNLHRRLGKTFLSVLMIIESCLLKPGTIAKFLCYTTSQAQDILDEHWSFIMGDKPDDGKIKVSRHTGKHYSFRSIRWKESRGSVNRKEVKSDLRLYGCKDDKGNKIRGTATDIIAIDECREMPHLDYTWGSVILPTFKGRTGNVLAIMMSTPPDTPDQAFASKYVPEAEEKGRYFCVPASLDETWTEEDDEVFAREMGGRDSVAYRREIECELIPDLDCLIVPEFAEKDGRDGGNELIYADRPYPSHYYGFAAGDFGGSKDSHGVCFGYYDFEARAAFIEDELWAEDIDSKRLIEAWGRTEKEVFEGKGKGHCLHIHRSLDTDSQRLRDYQELFGITIARAPHQELETNRALARVWFRQGRVRIHKRCVNLIRQLRNGTRDEKTGKFDRKPGMGHMDLVASVLYFVRDVDRKKVAEKNPFPEKPLPPVETHFISPELKKNRDFGWNTVFSGRRR